jgi:hypothetical protein
VLRGHKAVGAWQPAEAVGTQAAVRRARAGHLDPARPSMQDSARSIGDAAVKAG